MSEATHQLAAIMFTDIVGYTALMGEGEQRAIRLLDKNLSIQKPLIEQHKGKLLKEIGDGLLSSFNSVIEAVKCAIEIQDKLKDEPELNIRVGIHIGDVLFRDGDVLGDGVNIASRIESLASSGEILVSEAVYNSIKNQEGIHTEFVKEEILKNVEKPIEIYKVSAEIFEQERILDSVTPTPHLRLKTTKPFNKRLAGVVSIGAIIILVLAYFLYNQSREVLAEEVIEKSIAVLPFADLSEKGDQQFFVDGVMEDVLGLLQKMKELHVVSRTSVMKYRDNKPTIRQIRDELKVGYVLEGSVRKSTDEVMITAQLINVAEDRHLWAENYTSDYSAKGIFEIQGRIAKKIVNDLKLTISPEKITAITQAMTENTKAYEYFQNSKNHTNTPEGKDSAIVDLKKAIQIDREFGSAYGRLASMFFLKYVNFKQTKDFLDSAENYAKRGIKVDDNCAECYKILAGLEVQKYGNQNKAIVMFQKALKINPNNSAIMNNMLLYYYLSGEYENAIGLVSKIIKVFPNSDHIAYRLHQLYFHLGDYGKSEYFDKMMGDFEINELGFSRSITYADNQFWIGDVEGYKKGTTRIFQTTQDSIWFHEAIIGSFWLEKKYNEVIAYYEENQHLLQRAINIESWVGFSYLNLGKNTEASYLGNYLMEKAEKANKSLKFTAMNISVAYLLKNQKEQSITWLERAIDLGWLQVDISKYTFYESLKDHPHFQELVSKQKKKREEVMALVATYNFPEPEDL